MRVVPRLGATKSRTVTTLCGFGSGILWRVHNNSLVNLTRGLVERVYRVQSTKGLVPTPQPQPNAFARLDGFAQKLSRWLPVTAPVDYDTFVGYYKGRRHTLYRKAADSLLASPVQRSDAKVSTFVKAEKVNTTKKVDPAPRLIQPRKPRFNVALGVFLRPIEKLVYRAVAKVWGGITVFKGMNAGEQGNALRTMWECFNNPVAVGLDASRFDQHVSADALRWEHSVYMRAFRGEHRTTLNKLLSWQIKNMGMAWTQEGVVHYTVNGCRMSGDINTSLGNCLIMCALVHEWCRVKNVRARLANNGDDCVVIMDGSSLAAFTDGLTAWFLECGFQMEVEAPVTVFEEISFCQTQPVWTPDGWIMVRDPNVAISKDLVTLLGMPSTYKSYVGAIGSCGLSAYGGIPVYQDFYRSLSDAGKKPKLLDDVGVGRGLLYLSAGMKKQYTAIHPQTRASFAFAFGITPDEQEQLEAWLQRNPVPTQAKQIFTRTAPRWYK